jgi:putative transposase
MDFASWKDRKGVVRALRSIYRAADADAGQAALEAFAQGPWGVKYPAIAQSWLVILFFAFPEGVRVTLRSFTASTFPGPDLGGYRCSAG